MKRKVVVIGVIFLSVGLFFIPCITASENEDRYTLCFVESGDVQLRNFTGRFFGVPIVTGSSVRHYGFGTFQLNLLGWNESNETRLEISRFHTLMIYDQDVRIEVKAFIGWYQPTGGLSNGVLSGFAFYIDVY